MHDQNKTKSQLAEELRETRRLLAASEEAFAKLKREAASFDQARRQLLSIFDSIDEPIYVADPEA